MVDQPSPLVLPWFIRHNNYKESITLQNKTKSFKNINIYFYLFSCFYYYIKHDRYNSQLIRFARVSSHVDIFNTGNKVLTAKLLRQGYRYHKLRKAFSKFYRRNFDIVSKYNVGLKTLLLQGLSEPEFYGDLVYKFRKIIGKNDFPYHFKKIIVRYKKIGYNINVMRQTACLVVNPIKVNSFAFLFNCTTVGRTSY